MLAALFTLITTASAHWGNEHLSYARDARQILSLEQRLNALHAMAKGSASVTSGTLEISRETSQTRISVPGTEIFWYETDGRFEGYDTTATAALALSIVQDVPDRGPIRWDDVGARAMISRLDRIGPEASPSFRRAFWNPVLSSESRAAYLDGGFASALALYARALDGSLRIPKQTIFGRYENLFGEAEASNLTTLPKLAFEVADRTRLMNLLLTMVDVGLADGLDVDLNTSDHDDTVRAHAMGPRVHQLTPILRQIRDAPAFVRACFGGPSAAGLCELTRALAPAFERYSAYAEQWRRLDKGHEVIPTTLIEGVVAEAALIYDAISRSSYAGFPRRGCQRWLDLQGCR